MVPLPAPFARLLDAHSWNIFRKKLVSKDLEDVSDIFQIENDHENDSRTAPECYLTTAPKMMEFIRIFAFLTSQKPLGGVQKMIFVRSRDRMILE